MKTFYSFLVLLFSFQFLWAQNTKIIGMITSTMIPATSTNLVTYDYIQDTYDTIWHSSKLIGINDNTLCIDTQTDKVYFATTSGYCSGEIFNDIWMIDLKDTVVSHLFNLDGICSSVDYMFYDIFTNELLIRDTSRFFYYNISANTIDSTKISLNLRPVFCGQTEIFNPLTNEYFYKSDPLFYVFGHAEQFNLVDLENQIIIDTTNLYDVFGNDYFYYERFFNNILKNEYYLIDNQTKKIKKFDPINGDISDLVPLPTNYLSGYNSQFIVYDYYNDAIICPYSDKWVSNWLAVYDLGNDTMWTVSFERANLTNYHKLYPGYQTLLRKRQHFLEACLCDNYVWYLNDTVIQGQNAQHLFPTKSGTYKFSSMHDGVTYFSNSIEFIYDGIFDPNKPRIDIHPNPVNEYIYVDLLINTDVDKTITVYNSQGSVVKSIASSKSKMTVYVGDLANGMYYLNCNLKDGRVIQSKVLVLR